jgi:hypothetical protein
MVFGGFRAGQGACKATLGTRCVSLAGPAGNRRKMAAKPPQVMFKSR